MSAPEPNAAPPAAGETRPPDTFDLLAGVEPGSAVAGLRARRPDLTRFSQASYVSLLDPATDDSLSRRERTVVALRVALLDGDDRLASWYQERLIAHGAPAPTIAAVTAYPAESPALTAREVALLRHTDLLTRRPTEADQTDVAALREAGLTTTEIVTLAQLIAFVAYQTRVLATLRAFGATA